MARAPASRSPKSAAARSSKSGAPRTSKPDPARSTKPDASRTSKPDAARAAKGGAARPAGGATPRGAKPAATHAAVERLRKICLALPEAAEKISHGEPTWFAGDRGKVFASLDDHHHGAEHLSVWLPAPVGAQEALIESDPERYFRPPYVGHRGWVAVVLDGKPDWTVVAELVRDAYRQVASRKLVAALDDEAPASRRSR